MAARKRRFKGPVIVILAILAVVILSVLLVKGIVEKRRENVAELREGIAASRTTAGGQPSSQPGAGESGQSGQDGSQPSGAAGEVGGAAADDGAAPPPDGDEPGPPAAGTDLEVIRQSVTSFQSSPGERIAWNATVSGGAVSVSMSAVNSASGNSVGANLIAGPDNNGTVNWGVEGTAPFETGDWYYTTTAIAADGTSISVAGSYFQVVP